MTHSSHTDPALRLRLGVIQVEPKLPQTNSGLSSLKLNITTDSGKFKGPVKRIY